MKKTLILLLVLSAFLSCNKKNCGDQNNNPEYLIFGYASCFCFDCCKTGYKIAGTELFKGEKNNQGTYDFETTPLESSKYTVAKILVDDFPDELLKENGKTFGCAGCADQPVYYVELKQDGTVYHWQIDSQTDGFPAYVKDYSAKLASVFASFQ